MSKLSQPPPRNGHPASGPVDLRRDRESCPVIPLMTEREKRLDKLSVAELLARTHAFGDQEPVTAILEHMGNELELLELVLTNPEINVRDLLPGIVHRLRASAEVAAELHRRAVAGGVGAP